MKPQQAVDEFLETDMRIVNKGGLLSLFESVATTAKKDETRRCAARVKIWFARQPGVSIARNRSITKELVNDLLITGGLKAEP